MAYDLVVGKSAQIKDSPTIIAGIEFSEYPIICALAERTGSNFLHRISNLFQDQSFGISELEHARDQLFAVLLQKLEPEQKAFIYKMVTAVCFAIYKGLPLHGVAD